MDLPTVQAELLRRREEEDQAVRVQKTHADRRDDASEPARLSVFQKEGEILREPDTEAGLEIGENVTTGEIQYAEAHRHDAIGAAFGLAVTGVMGTSLDLQSGTPARRREDVDEDRGDQADDAAQPSDKERRRDREADGEEASLELERPMMGEPAKEEVQPFVARPERAVDGEGQLPGQSAAARVKRQMSADLAVTAEVALDQEPEREPDRDWDREMEMTR